MRSLISTLPVFVLAVLLPLGCKDDTSTPSSVQISSAEVAEKIGASLADSTGGITSQLGDLVGIIGGGSLGAPVSGTQRPTVPVDTVRFDITRHRSGLYSYNYVIHFWYAIQLTSIDFGYEMRGTYDTHRLASDDKAHAVWNATNLLAEEITVNGTYERLGTEQWKARGTSWQTELDITLVNVTISKTTGLITGGTATVALKIQGEGGASASYVATITFLGNRRAAVLLGGVQYIIDLSSGAIVTS